LFSAKVDPGEILKEYRTTRYPDRFFNLKIGVPWADLERRLDVATVLSLCSDELMLEAESQKCCYMGVDTGKALHVVMLRQPTLYYEGRLDVVHIGEYSDFEELDTLIEKFQVIYCVIDGLPETHATRAFARRHGGHVYLNFFNENQRGSARWDSKDLKVEVNRTEALDSSRAAIRDGEIALPRRLPIVEEFARHMSSDAKVLDEDPDTGAKKYRYIRTGADHYSMAFTYALMAAMHCRLYSCPVVFL
jgi:hypothetical protein